MKLPFVSRSTYMLMVAACNQASLDREHERTERRRTEGRYDDLLRDFRALRREGFVIPAPITVMGVEDESEPVSVDDADLKAAERQPRTVDD